MSLKGQQKYMRVGDGRACGSTKNHKKKVQKSWMIFVPFGINGAPVEMKISTGKFLLN